VHGTTPVPDASLLTGVDSRCDVSARHQKRLGNYHHAARACTTPATPSWVMPRWTAVNCTLLHEQVDDFDDSFNW